MECFQFDAPLRPQPTSCHVEHYSARLSRAVLAPSAMSKSPNICVYVCTASIGTSGGKTNCTPIYTILQHKHCRTMAHTASPGPMAMRIMAPRAEGRRQLHCVRMRAHPLQFAHARERKREEGGGQSSWGYAYVCLAQRAGKSNAAFKSFSALVSHENIYTFLHDLASLIRWSGCARVHVHVTIFNIMIRFSWNHARCRHVDTVSVAHTCTMWGSLQARAVETKIKASTKCY